MFARQIPGFAMEDAVLTGVAGIRVAEAVVVSSLPPAASGELVQDRGRIATPDTSDVRPLLLQPVRQGLVGRVAGPSARRSWERRFVVWTMASRRRHRHRTRLSRLGFQLPCDGHRAVQGSTVDQTIGAFTHISDGCRKILHSESSRPPSAQRPAAITQTLTLLRRRPV